MFLSYLPWYVHIIISVCYIIAVMIGLPWVVMTYGVDIYNFPSFLWSIVSFKQNKASVNSANDLTNGSNDKKIKPVAETKQSLLSQVDTENHPTTLPTLGQILSPGHDGTTNIDTTRRLSTISTTSMMRTPSSARNGTKKGHLQSSRYQQQAARWNGSPGSISNTNNPYRNRKSNNTNNNNNNNNDNVLLSPQSKLTPLSKKSAVKKIDLSPNALKFENELLFSPVHGSTMTNFAVTMLTATPTPQKTPKLGPNVPEDGNGGTILSPMANQIGDLSPVHLGTNYVKTDVSNIDNKMINSDPLELDLRRQLTPHVGVSKQPLLPPQGNLQPLYNEDDALGMGQFGDASIQMEGQFDFDQ